MCLGIPLRVLETTGYAAVCAGRDGGRVQVDTLLVGTVEPGQWLLAHLGVAREIIDAERAAQTAAALDALEAILRGDAGVDLDAHFADLVHREPQLPDFLRGDQE